MQDSSAQVHRGIDEGIHDPAIFGLNVKERFSDAYIGVVTEKHIGGDPRLRRLVNRTAQDRRGFPLPPFDRLAVESLL